MLRIKLKIIGLILVFSTLFPIVCHGNNSNGGNAQWIWQQEDGPANTWVAFRKTITIDEVPSEAITNISVDSKYWLWINGEMVLFEGGLARGAAPNTIYYDPVDLAPYLKEGENTIAILAWYWGRTRKSHADSGKGGLCVSADWNAALNTSSSWKMKVHPAYDPNSGGGGEDNRIAPYSVKFDARKAMGDWTDNAWYTVGYDDSSWDVPVEKGEIDSQPWGTWVERAIPQWNDRGLADYSSMTVNGSAIQLPYTNNTGSSVTVMAKLPFNQQITPFIKLSSSAGKTIVIKTDNNQHLLSSGYISKDGVQAFEGFTWFNGHNVRYIIPSGVEVKELKYRWTGVGDMKGTFECSDANLTRLWWMARNTLYICARDGYMDCPDRERALWIGDVGDQTGAVFYTLDEAGRKLLKKAIDNTIDYRIGDTISGLAPGYLSIDKNSEFVTQSLQFIDHVVWQYYYNTGDTATIANAYTPILNYLKLWTMQPDGMPIYRKGNVSWIDWGSDPDKVAAEATWYYMALKAAKRMAVTLEKNEDITWYDDRIQSIKQGYESKYWNENRYCTSGISIEERVSSLAVLSGLADEKHYDILTKEVLFPVRKSSPHYEWMVEEALMLTGYPEKALTRMKEVYNFEIIDPNLTTLYERFDTDPGSLGTKNHAWNAPNYVMSRYITGIKATEVAWSTYEVCPTLGHLTSFKSVVPSVKGDIAVEVQASNTYFNLNLESPDHTTATIGIPKNGIEIIEVKAGGQTIWKDSTYVSGVLGLTFESENDDFLKFKVEPGNWNIHATIYKNTPPVVSFNQPTNDLVLPEGYDTLLVDVEATDEVGLIDYVQLFVDDVLISSDDEAPYLWGNSDQTNLLGLPIGEYVIKALATDTTGLTDEASFVLAVIDSCAADNDEDGITNCEDLCPDDPDHLCGYVAKIPGRIEVEDYSSMWGVKIDASGHYLNYIGDWDWMEYQLAESSAGLYEVSYKLAAASEPIRFELLVDGNPVKTVNAEPTGSFTTYVIVKDTVLITTSPQTIGIRSLSNSWNFDWIEFDKLDTVLTGLATICQGIESFIIMPNPVINAATIEFGLETESPVNLSVLNVQGKLLDVLYQGRTSAGIHRLTWDGTNTNSYLLSNGIYFLRLTTEYEVFTRKISIIR